MKAEDIKKALVCCSSDSKKSCKKCPYVTVKGFCYNKLERDVLNLINQQQTEIKRLEKLLDDKCDRCISKDKAEAIKEFADRLKDVFVTIDGTFECCEIEDHIDNLVKEMVGDNQC